MLESLKGREGCRVPTPSRGGHYEAMETDLVPEDLWRDHGLKDGCELPCRPRGLWNTWDAGHMPGWGTSLASCQARHRGREVCGGTYWGPLSIPTALRPLAEVGGRPL